MCVKVQHTQNKCKSTKYNLFAQLSPAKNQYCPK